MICTIQPVYDLAARAAYLCEGVGERRRAHRAAGTDRLMPGSFIDAPDMAAFVSMGNLLTTARRVKAQSIVISLSPEEADKTDAIDQRLVGGVAYEVASRAFPKARIAVVVHGDGGASHAHVLVVNDQDGHALRENRAHWALKLITDQVAREAGLSVIEQPSRKGEARPWAERRSALAGFDLQLGDAIHDALAESSSVDWPSFHAALARRGVEAILAEHPGNGGHLKGGAARNATFGLTYKMRDATFQSKPARLRRRKASALSRDFCFEAVDSTLAARMRRNTPSPRQTMPSPAFRHAAQARRSMSTALGRVVFAGLFASLDGWEREVLKVGIRVLRSPHPVGLRYRQGGHEFAASDLGDEFTESGLRSIAEELSVLRQLAPPGTEEMSLPDLVALMQANDDTQHPRKVRRSAAPPARQRHLELRRSISRSLGE